MLLDHIASLVSSASVQVLDDVEDVDEASEQVSRFGLRPNRITPLARPLRLKARIGVVPPKDAVSYARISYGADVEVRPLAPEDDVFMYALVLGGKAHFSYGGTTAFLGVNSAGFIPPYKEFRSIISSDLDQIALAINRQRLETLAALMLDMPSGGRIEFDPGTDIVQPSASLLHLIASTLQVETGPVQGVADRIRGKLETALIESALVGMPSFRQRIEDRGAASSRATRVAMAFMREHLAEPLSLTEVASAAATSPRALQAAFSKELGLSPMRWLREQRLHHARSLLLSPDSARLSIADVAYASGFLHLGDFSRRFRERYNVTPSEWRRSSRNDSDFASTDG